MKALFLLFSVFLTSCAGQVYSVKGFEKEVEVFQTEFVKRGNERISDLIVEFNEVVGERVVGMCIRNYETPRVVIKQTFWETASKLQREALILHELGHCILDRDHSNYSRNGYPMSLMNSSLLQEVDYKRYRKYYINELFSGF